MVCPLLMTSATCLMSHPEYGRAGTATLSGAARCPRSDWRCRSAIATRPLPQIANLGTERPPVLWPFGAFIVPRRIRRRGRDRGFGRRIERWRWLRLAPTTAPESVPPGRNTQRRRTRSPQLQERGVRSISQQHDATLPLSRNQLRQSLRRGILDASVTDAWADREGEKRPQKIIAWRGVDRSRPCNAGI